MNIQDYIHDYIRDSIFWLFFSACANATFSLFNLSLSDIVDHDIEKFQRRFVAAIYTSI